MGYKLRKDESDLIAKWRLKAGKKHYFHVFLWGSQESFDENTNDNKPGTSSGCANLAPSILKFDNGEEKEVVRPKLGEIHFIKDQWNMEIVAHELCHGLIQRLRMITPNAESVIEQENDSEETICYEFGAWMDDIYRLLWAENPNGQWSENGEGIK